MSQLNHDCIIKPIKQVTTSHGEEAIVFPYYPKTLKERILKGFNEEWKILFYFIQICRAVNYINKRNIVHFDIRAENIMIGEDKRCVLIDFGVA